MWKCHVYVYVARIQTHDLLNMSRLPYHNTRAPALNNAANFLFLQKNQLLTSEILIVGAGTGGIVVDIVF